MRPKEVPKEQHGYGRSFSSVKNETMDGWGVTGQLATSWTSIFMLVIVLGGVIVELTGGIMEWGCIWRGIRLYGQKCDIIMINC